MIPARGEYPRIVSFLTYAGFQTIFALVSLVLILVFDISVFIFRPYDGLVFGESEATVVASVDKGSPAGKAGVLPGDKFLMIDDKPVNQWLYAPMYRPGIKAGDTVAYQVQRDSQILTLIATMGGFFNNPYFFGPIIGMQILSVAFWLIGLLLCLFAQPDDTRARLAGLVWLLTGIAVASGGPGGASYFWGSGTVMKVSWAFLGFLLVTLHLYFPASTLFEPHRKRVVGLFAVIAVLLTAVTILDDTIFKTVYSAYTGLNNLVYGFFILSVFASLVLLLRGYFRVVDMDLKRQTGIILWGMAFGFLPFLSLTSLPLLFNLPYIDGAYTSLFLILIPLSYAYVIYQHKLLKVDLIINRLVVFFIMGLLVLTTSFITLMLFSAAVKLPSSVPIVGSIMAVIVALPSAGLRDQANRWVSRTLYGAYYDYASVAGSLSSRLAQALERGTLASLLTRDLAQQMGIQQTALLLLEGDNLNLWRQADEDDFTASQDDELCKTLLDASLPMRAQNLWSLLSRRALEHWQRFTWGELFVPIIYEKRMRGILILGGRIAGDIYSDQDMRIVMIVAQQGALAFSNIQLVETLRGLSQQLVRAGEDGRKQVVRDLHDGVLQNLSFIRQLVNKDPEVVKYLGDVITTVRGILQTQRPLVLDIGLIPALDDLVDTMNKLVGEGGPHIDWRCTIDDIHLPDEEATAIYRIAQESISNAIHHAQACHIEVNLSRNNGTLVLTIEDDGVGMPLIPVSEDKYGLIGMRERAIMIDADLRIISNQGEGTKIVMEYPSC